MNSFDSFTLAPMSAGDIIDRAVRLYGRNFLALLRIVLAPSLVAYAGSILISMGLRNATLSKGDERVVLTVLLVMGGFLLWAIGKAAFYALLGGSSRSLVAHFFDGKPILARDVYRAARERVWSLIGATIIVGLLILGAMVIGYLFLVFIGIFFVMMMAMIAQSGSEIIRGVGAIIFAVVVAATIVFFFFLIYCRIIYVPQILMVEGKGVFNSIGRSFSLAGGQLRRVAALVLFWIYVGWSVLLLLFLPLGYISDWVIPFGAEHPPWYDIAWQTVGQLSEILLMPIFMIGCTLLYLDSRVRKEGFDVELLANRTLAPPPGTPPIYPIKHEQSREKWTGPMWTPAPQQHKSFQASILGLDDYISPPTDPFPPFFEDGGQVVAEAARRSCQRCGAETDAEDLFCRQCGSDFDQDYSQ
ncbi:MAG: zinc ribbon domain-containing protein [Blastocatellia bacterium]|nr:zinc ribbon domain-containing protein [Blastocatellia bacterium]